MFLRRTSGRTEIAKMMVLLMMASHIGSVVGVGVATMLNATAPARSVSQVKTAPTDEPLPKELIGINANASEATSSEPLTAAPLASTTSPKVETATGGEESIKDVITMPTDEVSKNESKPLQDDEFWESQAKASHIETRESDDGFSPDDPQIQLDAAEQYVSCCVHAMLFFFLALAVISAVLAIIMVSQYGFFAFFIISLFLCVVVGLVMFVDKVMKEDARLKPVRRQIRRWKAVATAVVLKEIRDFQLDWNEHLLLTDGSEYNLYDDDEVPTMDVDSAAAAAAAKESKPKKKHGPRSTMFKLVKPFLKVGGRRRARRNEKKQAAASAAKEANPSENYVPPIV